MKVFIPVLIVWAALLGLTATTFYGLGYHNGRLDTLPTQSEVQEALGLEPDGIIGSESRRVWDATVEQRTCNEAAVGVMRAFNRDFDRICLNGMEFD